MERGRRRRGERGGESLIDSLIFVASQQVGTFANVVQSLSATLEYIKVAVKHGAFLIPLIFKFSWFFYTKNWGLFIPSFLLVCWLGCGGGRDRKRRKRKGREAEREMWEGIVDRTTNSAPIPTKTFKDERFFCFPPSTYAEWRRNKDAWANIRSRGRLFKLDFQK